MFGREEEKSAMFRPQRTNSPSMFVLVLIISREKKNLKKIIKKVNELNYLTPIGGINQFDLCVYQCV